MLLVHMETAFDVCYLLSEGFLRKLNPDSLDTYCL